MARVLIFGGHGKVALLLEKLLVERGDDVTAVIRNPEHAGEIEQIGATPLVSDLETLDVAGIAALVSGQDAVVWSAGAGGGDADRTRAVDRDAASRSVDAAERAGVSRYVMVSYFGAGADHGVSPDDDFFAYAEAKAAADEHVRRSSLDATIVAPSALTLDPPTGRIEVGAAEGSSVPRADVAAVIAAVLLDPTTIGRTIEFNSGDRPIADAVHA